MAGNINVPEAVYEELKMLAAMQESCTLQFRADNGGVATVQTKIQDVFRDSDGDFLLMQGVTLRLHQLVSINVATVESFC